MKKLILASILIFTLAYQAASATHRPLMRDIGVLGLFSHDLFAWDSEQSRNTENGRLDLSTIFDYENGSRIDQGGDKKNSENAPVFSITMQLVDFYKNELARLEGSDEARYTEARRRTVNLFHSWVRASFERLTTLPFPRQGLNQDVNNNEQAAMRAMHDILPGRAIIYGRVFPRGQIKVTNWVWARLRLNQNELNQTINAFNGDYDEEYRDINIPFAPIRIDLKMEDKNFVERFSDLNFEDMLAELAQVGAGEMQFSQTVLAPVLTQMAAKALLNRQSVDAES